MSKGPLVSRSEGIDYYATMPPVMPTKPTWAISKILEVQIGVQDHMNGIVIP